MKVFGPMVTVRRFSAKYTASTVVVPMPGDPLTGDLQTGQLTFITYHREFGCCPYCNGKGTKFVYEKHHIVCHACAGSGFATFDPARPVGLAA